MNRDIEDVKNNDAEEEVDSGVDGEGGHDSPAKDEEVEDDNVNKEVEEPEEEADYELIESVVFKGKMIRRQLSVQSHSKSVADLFSRVNSVDEANLSITGSRKVQQNKHFLTILLPTIRLFLSFLRFQIDFIPIINILFTSCFVDDIFTSVSNLFLRLLIFLNLSILLIIFITLSYHAQLVLKQQPGKQWFSSPRFIHGKEHIHDSRGRR